ncbi:MAG: response regulator [Elusimicrobia bacterium]|nr:response regulator [Elusimicrobiota bacterium]
MTAPAPGRVLLVGIEGAAERELSAFLSGFERELASDARRAALRIRAAEFAAAVFDASRLPAADREALAVLQRERGFVLLGLEPDVPLSPAAQAPLRRLPWPLPLGFLDQVRAAKVPVVFLVAPTLFLTHGIQNALRQAGVQFFQTDGSLGLIEMLREQVRLAEEAAASPGLLARLTGRAGSGDPGLGRVAVVKFAEGPEEAVNFDARLRQALPGTAVYLATAVDPVAAAAAAAAAGRPALLPRECVPRLAEILLGARGGVCASPGGERILLVDNDMPTLSRLSEALLALGYEVETALRGEEALRLAESRPFALAAIGGSALETTKLSGAHLAVRLRERDKDLRIVLLVDQFPVQDALKGVSRAVELGLDDALLKPVDVSRLALSIRRALERRFLLLENARLLREVQESARQLAQVNGFQAKFFATVAHDVKNPLTAILGYAELLGARLKDRPDLLAFASYIHKAAQALNLLVSDLVDLAAIESGKLRVELGPLDLAQVVSDVASRVAVAAQAKKLTFEVRGASGLPALRGDPHRIGQVLQNLCTNAVQYTPEGGAVSIEAGVAGGRVRVGVRDTGIGIAPEDLPRVWERFFQARQAQDLRKAGFGLGLKIAREIVQRHGGEMEVESNPGKGSFFYFTLPVPPA